MNETTTVTLVKSDKEQFVDLLTSLVALGLVYYIANPSAFDPVIGRIKTIADRAIHRVSVWQARQAIRSLPETDE